MLQCVAACRSVLWYLSSKQCVAMAACCSVLQCVAVCCSVLQCVVAARCGPRVPNNELPCVAMC